MAPNDKTAQETNFAEFLNKTVQETEETIKMLKETEEKFKTILPSPFGSIQAINTTDDLFFNNPVIEVKRSTSSPSSARKELAVYKTLSEEEWKKYFGLFNTTRLKQKQAEQLRTYIRKSTEEEPYLRRLVRETIQHGKPIIFSSTPEDWELLKGANAVGATNCSARRIRLLPEEIDSSTVFHEILHIGQDDDNVKEENDNRYSRELVQKQHKFAEAEARSIDYLCERQKHDYPNNYLDRLIEKNEHELRKNQKNIPADLTAEEKELFIHTQAVNRAIGASIHILMQPMGKKTQEAAAAYGIKLTDRDFYCVNHWKEYYNDYHKKGICENYASQKDSSRRTDNKDREQFVYNYVTNRYPVLKGKDFLVTGLTEEEQESWDIRKPGRIYAQLTDEQIRAENLLHSSYYDKEGNIGISYIVSEKKYNVLLTEEEMNYLAKIRDARDKFIETDIPMPASLKKIIETEKTLHSNSEYKAVAAFQKLEASRKELLENKNQQSYQTTALNFWRITNPKVYKAYKELFGNDKEAAENQQSRLTAIINANAKEYAENGNTSSNTLPEKER